MHVIHGWKTSITIILLLALTQTSAFADGFRNTPEGARAIGMAGANRAFADDANTVIHNSANMVDLNQPIIQFNVTGGHARNTFNTTGGSDKTENPDYAIPGFAAAVPLKDGKYALGFAAYVPYGRSVDWGNKDYFATMGYPYKGSMTVFDFTPNVAMRLTDSLSVGVGLDFYYGKVEQHQFINQSVGPFVFGPYVFGPYRVTSYSRIKGDDTALGWNAAVTWKMTEKQRLAFTYRAPFTLKYKGENYTKTYASPPVVNNDMTTVSKVSAEIEYPTIVGLAYGIELTDTLRAEINAEWLEFSVYENLTIQDSTYGPISSPQNMDNTWTIAIGGEWEFTTNWTLRAGYKYLNAPTPDSTYSPMGPDEDQGVLAVGLGYETEHHMLDFAYSIGLFDGRNIEGSANSPDGYYDYDIQVISLSYGYKF